MHTTIKSGQLIEAIYCIFAYYYFTNETYKLVMKFIFIGGQTNDISALRVSLLCWLLVSSMVKGGSGFVLRPKTS